MLHPLATHFLYNPRHSLIFHFVDSSFLRPFLSPFKFVQTQIFVLLTSQNVIYVLVVVGSEWYGYDEKFSTMSTVNYSLFTNLILESILANVRSSFTV